MSRKAPNTPASELRFLGRPSTFPATPARETLDTFKNRHAQRDYSIRFECEDFTSLCPVTGQPDFARIVIDYVPHELCLETKALKYYLSAYRNTPSFNEEIVNRILDDLAAVCQPRKMLVHGEFAQRGGISVTVDAELAPAKRPRKKP